jgi:hypothetical protein
MKKRCYYTKCNRYNYYGGRGIKLCDEWNDRTIIRISGIGYTKGFLAFKKWALENGYQDNLSIDRIDVNGNYEPSNCRWVTKRVQANNCRNNKYITYKGKTQSMADWCRELGLDYVLMQQRFYKGWTPEKAFKTPLKKLKYKK